LSTSIVLPTKHQPVTNIGELLHALAVGWQEGGCKRNRFLIAGDGGQFIRTPESSFGRYHRNYYETWDGDIMVESTYRMTGFIQFECKYMFPNMFKRYQDDQHTYLTAELTREGFEYASKGVIDIDLSNDFLKRCKFFNPAYRDVTQKRLESPPISPILIDQKPGDN
jgi:hypothetical protein